MGFIATLTGATGAIGWTLTGPGSLSSTSGANVTYTPPPTLPADTRASITITGGGVSAQATILLARGPVTVVTGRVIDGVGAPVPAISVSIGDRSSVTDQSGHFVLESVGTSYTLSAWSVEQNQAVVYEGLTRADPAILWRNRLSAATVEHGGQVAGTIDGGAPASTDGLQTLLVFASREAQTRGSTFTPTYSLPVSWTGDPITTGSVHVLQLTSGATGALPTALLGYGMHPGIAVRDSETTPGIDVTLAPVTPSSVRGTYALPGDYVFFARILALGFDDGAFMSLGFDDSGGLDFTYPVPDGIDATVELLAEAAGPGVEVLRRETGIAPGSADILLALPEGAASISPADGADGIGPETEFSWGTFPGGVFTVDFSAPPPGPTFHVVTMGTSTFIPQLAALPLPSGTHYTWMVTATGPFGSVDEAAGPHTFTPPGSTLVESFSEARGFISR